MTPKHLGAAALLAATALFVGTAHAAGDPAQGKIASQTCLGCHGVAGYTNMYPDYAVPRLAGQHATYIVKALNDYKDGKRDFATMHAQASELSDQQMQDIAAYFASLGKAYEAATDNKGDAK